MKQKRMKNYVSDIDRFLYEFDEHHEKSLSQQEEIFKHERIFKLRGGDITHSSPD